MKDDYSIFTTHDKIVLVLPIRMPETAYVIWGKRIFDIVFSATALVLLSPIIAVIWCIVPVGGGKGFYGQERVGKGRRLFKCWKLRSMIIDSDLVLARLCASDGAVSAEWERNQKLAVNPRITRFGKFIRKTRIDELPQLWNVLIGDMSIVGPRPFMHVQLPIYVRAGGSAYFGLRPGLTGPWQIASKNGADLAFVARVDFDEDYGSKISFLGDIGIILKTIKTVFRMNGQ